MSRRKRFTRNLGRKLPSPLAVRTTVEWVRFEHEHEPFGIFRYLDEATEVLAHDDAVELERLCDWFTEHLDAPDLMTVERFWFCAEALEHVAQARKLAKMLCSVKIPIVERRTRRVPGKVKWQDDHQVAVLMYRDTPQPGRPSARETPPQPEVSHSRRRDPAAHRAE